MPGPGCSSCHSFASGDSHSDRLVENDIQKTRRSRTSASYAGHLTLASDLDLVTKRLATTLVLAKGASSDPAIPQQ